MLLTPQYKEHVITVVVDEAQSIKTFIFCKNKCDRGEFHEVFYLIGEVFYLIGEIRSIIPVHVNLMALKATATCDTFNV